jgi:hypothetical protein
MAYLPSLYPSLTCNLYLLIFIRNLRYLVYSYRVIRIIVVLLVLRYPSSYSNRHYTKETLLKL